MSITMGNSKKRKPDDADVIFKLNMHDSYVPSAVPRGCVNGLKGKVDEFFRSCPEMCADGRRMIGRETESTSRDHGSIRMDNVFDVKIPGEKDAYFENDHYEGLRKVYSIW